MQPKRRESIAIAVGMGAIVLAAAIGAEERKADTAAMLTQGKRYVDRMQEMVGDGAKAYEEARKSGVQSRMECVNEALPTLKGLLRLSEGNYSALQEAVATNDTAAAEADFVKISVAVNKAEELFGQLMSCVGAPFFGPWHGPYMEKQIDPDLPDIDPTTGLESLNPQSDVAPSTTPFFIEK
jgi:hypothetical protein